MGCCPLWPLPTRLDIGPTVPLNKAGLLAVGMSEGYLSTFFVELFLEAILKFGADFCDFHSRADQEFAAQEFVRLVLVRQFAGHAAILAILIPAETSVGNGFRADVLKTAENRILLGDLEGLAENFDLDQAFVRTENLIRGIRARCYRDLRLT
jgi:hypothetical protein